MSRLGLAFGLALLFVFALVAAYSSELLRALTLVTGAGTYGEVLARIIGPRWKRACDAVVVLYAWGTAVGYLLIVKEQLHRVAAFFDGGDGPLPWEENKSALLVVVAALVVFPLSVLRDLSALKYTSALGAVAAAYIVTIVSFYAPWDRPGSGDDASRHAVVFGIRACAATSSNGAASLALWPASATSALTAVPMLSFALNSGWAFVPIVSQLENPTPSARSGADLSRPRSLSKLLSHGLPDRDIIEGGPPESIADAFQAVFAARIAETKIACAQARAQMGWPARGDAP